MKHFRKEFPKITVLLNALSSLDLLIVPLLVLVVPLPKFPSVLLRNLLHQDHHVTAILLVHVNHQFLSLLRGFIFQSGLNQK